MRERVCASAASELQLLSPNLRFGFFLLLLLVLVRFCDLSFCFCRCAKGNRYFEVDVEGPRVTGEEPTKVKAAQ